MSPRKSILIAILSCAALSAGPVALAQHGHVLQNEKDVQWADGPPMLPPGAKMAVVDGNPRGKGLFAVRLKFPAGYQIPAHSHPADEHVVVLSGTFYMGMGDKLDREAGQALTTGGFAVMPAQKNHFAYTKEGATVLVYGIGPIEFTYVNPADDPRKAEKK
jgi:quercetin dioxygenase-like cupin family protein